MNCQETQARLSEYLDCSLSATQLAIVQEHLAACPSCQEEAALLKETIEQVAALPLMDMPLGFNQRIMASVREIEIRPGYGERLFWGFRRSLPIHSTALVAMGILGIFLWAREDWQNQPTLPSSQQLSSTTVQESIPTSAESDTKEVASRQADQQNDMPREDTPNRAPQPNRQASDERPKQTIETSTKIAAEPANSRGVKSAGSAPDVQPVEAGRAPAATTRPESGGRGAPVIARTPVGNHAQSQWGTPVTFSFPVESEFRSPAPEPFADYELTVRRRSRAAEAAQQDNSGEKAPRRAIDRLMAAIPDHSRPQTIWVNVPKNQYEQFKKELDALGTIESELAVPLLREQSAVRGDGHVRVKLTAMPTVE
jgi:Putative zinc-finger